MTRTSIFMLITSLILTSCQISSPSPSPAADPTSTPEAVKTEASDSEERTLIYCQRSDPESLYPFGEAGFLDAIYDGPYNSRSYGFQPVILKKLPSLTDGDAQLLPVMVKAGDQVVDAAGSLVTLEAGARVRPSGCQADECAIEYDGSSTLQMDQLVARFELLPGMLWSDGAPLNAFDSVYSFNLQSDPDTPVDKDLILHTTSYQVLDELSTQWSGLPGYLDSFYSVNFFTPVPRHAWEQYTASELLTAEVSSQRPVGWGPYVVEDFMPGEGITLHRNENYFRKSEGLPHFDRLSIRFLEKDINANIAQLLSGECDIWNIGVTGIQDRELLSEFDAKGQINAVFVAGPTFWHLDFGIQPASYDDGWQPGDRPDFFGDVRVRRAFALCLDRQSILQAATLIQPSVPDSYLPPQHPLYNPDVIHYDFDPAAGSALLEEAGWVMGEGGVRIYAGDNPRIPSGTRFSVENFVRNSFDQGAAQIMVASLAQCGIEIKPSYYDSGQLFADGPEGPVFGRKFDLAQFVWLGQPFPPCNLWLSENIPGEDSEKFPLGWYGQNDPGFSSTEYDRACRSALHSLPDWPSYAENHMRAQRIFAKQLPELVLYFDVKTGATRPDFCGYIIDPTVVEDTWNIEAFDYGEDC